MKKIFLCFLVFSLLLVCSFAFAESSFLDSNEQEGIYFSVSHPDCGQYKYAGLGIGPYKVHKWKEVSISVILKVKNEEGKVFTIYPTGGNWETSGNTKITEEDGTSRSFFMISSGSGTVKYSCTYNGTEYSGSVKFVIDELQSPTANVDTLRYAALSMLSYSDLANYKGKTVLEIATPKDAGGEIEAKIEGSGTQILANDTYKVYADERDFIVACAGNCKIIDTCDDGSFHGVLFLYGSQYIMAYRGTNNIGNVVADVKLGLGLAEKDQFVSALDFYEKHKSKSPVLTGHSLGGGLANYVSVLTGAKAYTFNAPSTMVTAVSNFVNKVEGGRFGQNFTGLNDGLRIDYVNSCDWIGKVGAGDSKDGLYTGKSSSLQSGKLDKTAFYAHAVDNNSVYPLGAFNDHCVMRMIKYDENAETVNMTSKSSSTSPSEHSFSWRGGYYYFGSTGKDVVSSTTTLTGNSNSTAFVFSGNGDDDITLSNYQSEIIVAGKGNDTISSYSTFAGTSKYYYYSGDGFDTIYDSLGTDSLYIDGISNVSITRYGEAWRVYNGDTSACLAELHVNFGSGSFSIYKNGTLFKKISRELLAIKTLDIKCPVKICIYDTSDTLVETIEDGKIYDGNGDYGYFSTYESDDGYGKIVSLTSEQYHAVVLGIGEGSMNYRSNFTDEEGNSVTKAISTIPVHSGSIYYPASADDEYLLTADLDGDGTIDYSPSNQEITSLSLENSLTLEYGSTAQLNPVWLPAANTPDLVWSSSDPDIVSVTDSGLLAVNGTGEATITVIAQNGTNIEASCVVTVPDSLSIADAVVTGIDSKVLFTNAVYYPDIQVSYNGAVLTEGIEYSIEYSSEVMPGTAQIIIRGLGSFEVKS